MINQNSDFEGGIVLNINKPYGWTSTDIVRKIKIMMRKLGYPKIKIGHAGTLDPLATGVLLICIGRATKQVNELQAQQKEYLATIQLGATTPSYDLEHPIDHNYPWEHITEDDIRRVLDQMVGDQEQVPPLYSAKKIDGRRAYLYAREGVDMELKTAPITIYQAELIDYTAPYAQIRIRCSKGTYVRSIARDLGVELSSGGHLTALRRTQSGGFLAQEGYDLEILEKKLLPSETKEQ